MVESDRKRLTIILLGILTITLGVISIIIALGLNRGGDSSVAYGNVAECGSCTTGGEIECASGICCPCGKCGGTNYTCNQICSQNACDGTTSSSSGGSGTCPGNGKPIIWCTTWNCPNGDTSRDGQCTSADEGATVNAQAGAGCPNPPSGCGQVDFYDAGPVGENWGAYCGHTFLNACTPSSSSGTTSSSSGGPSCGDGVRNGSEQCDPTANPTGCGAGSTCRNDCTCRTTPVCGDGTKNGTEQCDPNANPTGCSATGSTCTSSCTCTTPPTCGDGTVNGGEQCDPTSNTNTCGTGSSCRSNCTCTTPELCGNGTVDSMEQCDPNANPTGCSANQTCQTNCLCSLPPTALISDDVDRVLLAVLVVILGAIIFKYRLIDRTLSEINLLLRS